MKGKISSLHLSDFGVAPGTGRDIAPAIHLAVQACRERKIRRLVIPCGHHDLWPDHAAEEFLHVSNNDAGLKRIAFSLRELNGLEIEGSGAHLCFHGPMVPFLVERSKGITIRNLSFDFVRAFHSEGVVLAVTPEWVDLEFSPEFPYAIRQGVLIFTSPPPSNRKNEVIYPFVDVLAFDAHKREPAYMAKDCYHLQHGVAAKETGPRRVRLFLENVSAKAGNILVFGAPRHYPGVVITDSFEIRLDGVTIHHCGGMGVIAQRSSNLFLRRVRVVPPEAGNRVVSVTADATHFVNAKGRIEIEDCVFESQKDDATNIHGLYAKITGRIGPDEIEVKLVHRQQFGTNFIWPGTRLELTRGSTLEPLGHAVVASVLRINQEYTRVRTKTPLPGDLHVGDVVADAEANTAEVLIRNCRIGKNRARGILLGSRGKTVVEGNTFHSPGAAILFEGDARFWFEQAGVRGVVIRKNVFDNNNYGVWGAACIEVDTGMDEAEQATSRYNRDILIEDNLFRVFDETPLLSAYAVDGLTFRNNRIERTDAYPPQPANGRKMFTLNGGFGIEIVAPEIAATQSSALQGL